MLGKILARRRDTAENLESKNLSAGSRAVKPGDSNRTVKANVAYPFRDEKSTSFPAPLAIDASVLTDGRNVTTGTSKNQTVLKQEASVSGKKDEEESKKEEKKEKKKSKSKKDKEVEDEEQKENEPNTCPPQTCKKMSEQKLPMVDEIIPNNLTEIINSSIKEAMENIVKKCSLVPEMQESKAVRPAAAEKRLKYLENSVPCKTPADGEYGKKVSKRRAESRERRHHRREKFDECTCSPHRKRSSREKKSGELCRLKEKIHEERSKKYSRLKKNLKSDNRRMTGNVNIYICSEATENKQNGDKDKKEEKSRAESSTEVTSNCTYSNTVCSSSSKLFSSKEKIRTKQRHEREELADCLCKKGGSYSEGSSVDSTAAWGTDYKNSRALGGRWDNDLQGSRETSSGDIDVLNALSSSSTRDGCLCNDTNFSGTNMVAGSDVSIPRSRFTTCNRQGPYRPNDSRIYPTKSRGSSNESIAWEPISVCTNADGSNEDKNCGGKCRESAEERLDYQREETGPKRRRNSHSRKRERHFAGIQNHNRPTCACIAEEEEECCANLEGDEQPKEPSVKVIPCPAVSKPSTQEITVCSNALEKEEPAEKTDEAGKDGSQIELDEGKDLPKPRKGLLRIRAKAKNDTQSRSKPLFKKKSEVETKVNPLQSQEKISKVVKEPTASPQSKTQDSFFSRSFAKAIGIMNNRPVSKDNSKLNDYNATAGGRNNDITETKNITNVEQSAVTKKTWKKNGTQRKPDEEIKNTNNGAERPKTKLQLILERKKGYQPNAKRWNLPSALARKSDKYDGTKTSPPMEDSRQTENTPIIQQGSKKDVRTRKKGSERYTDNLSDDKSETKSGKNDEAVDMGRKLCIKDTIEGKAHSKQDEAKNDGIVYVPCDLKIPEEEPTICCCKTTISDTCCCTCPECKNCKKPKKNCCCIQEENKKEICQNCCCPTGNDEKNGLTKNKDLLIDRSTERFPNCGPCCKAKKERPASCESCCRPKVDCKCKKMLICVACCRPKAECNCKKTAVRRGPVTCSACCRPKNDCRCRKAMVCLDCCKPADDCRCKKSMDGWERKSMICVYCDCSRDCCTCRIPVRKCSYCGMSLEVCNCKDPETCSVTSWKPLRNIRRCLSRNLEDLHGGSAEECRCHDKSKPYGCEELPYQRLRVFSNVMSELQQKMCESVCCTRCRRIPCCCGLRINKNCDWKEGIYRMSPKSRRKMEYGDDGKRSRIPEGCRCGGSSPKNDQHRCGQPLRVCCICRTTPCRCRKARSAPKKPRAKCYYCKNSPCICMGATESSKARPCKCGSLPYRGKDEEIVSRSKQPCAPKTEGKLICVRESEVPVCPVSRKHRRREN